MRNTEQEIAQNLRDAGCDEQEIDSILRCCREGRMTQAKKQIAACRGKQLARMHDSQRCIDRLDYLSYHLETGK